MRESSTFNDVVMVVIGTLLTISIGLSAYIFKNLDGRLTVIEQSLPARGERIAILEQQARENADAHKRIESKLDELHGIVLAITNGARK